jgi:hypothetical protein
MKVAFPAEFDKIVKDIVYDHNYVKKTPNALEAASKEAWEVIRKHPSYTAFAVDLAQRAVEEHVEDCRHRDNVRFTKDKILETQTPKAVGLKSKGMPMAHQAVSILEGYILDDGVMIGEQTGKDLKRLRAKYTSMRDTLDCKIQLIDALIPLVPDDKKIKDCLTEKQLDAIFKPIFAHVASGA